MNDDLISRQAVLDILEREGHKWGNDYRDWVDAIEEIKKLPSVNPQEPKWIPVSERLPEIHQDVLVSLRSLDVEVGFRAETEPCFYCEGDYIELQNVLAWMPLPKPYKSQESEDKENNNE